MKIALIAHDSKKELMTQFCIAYCGILSQHTIFSTATTGRNIESATGLQVEKYLAGTEGGIEQIAAMISLGEVDLLIFFRDPFNLKPHSQTEQELIRLCDAHSVPCATNIATAEPLIMALENGLLDWRKNSKDLNT